MKKFNANFSVSMSSKDLHVKAEVVRPIWADFSMARIWWQQLESLSNIYGMSSEEMIEIAISVYPEEDKGSAVEAYLFACLRARSRLANKPHLPATPSYGLHARASQVSEIESAHEADHMLLVDDAPHRAVSCVLRPRSS
jgi:hypothetical protein